MRLAALFLMPLLASAAAADEKTIAPAAAPGPISVNVNYTLNLPADAATPEAEAALERSHRKAMYAKAAHECEDILASIAATCQITNIGLSTQVNRYPGQPATIYVNASVTMQIALKP